MRPGTRPGTLSLETFTAGAVHGADDAGFGHVQTVVVPGVSHPVRLG
jgi:hypothetical protein